jgi:hypothetical protein
MAKTRQITKNEMEHAKTNGEDVGVYPIVEVDGKTYIQCGSIRLKHGPQTVMVIDITDEKDTILTDRRGLAYVEMGEGRYVLVLTTCSWRKTDWGQYLPADLLLEVGQLSGDKRRNAVSEWLENQYDN